MIELLICRVVASNHALIVRLAWYFFLFLWRTFLCSSWLIWQVILNLVHWFLLWNKVFFEQEFLLKCFIFTIHFVHALWSSFCWLSLWIKPLLSSNPICVCINSGGIVVYLLYYLRLRLWLLPIAHHSLQVILKLQLGHLAFLFLGGHFHYTSSRGNLTLVFLVSFLRQRIINFVEIIGRNDSPILWIIGRRKHIYWLRDQSFFKFLSLHYLMQSLCVDIVIFFLYSTWMWNLFLNTRVIRVFALNFGLLKAYTKAWTYLHLF